jgi:hypothetical protein
MQQINSLRHLRMSEVMAGAKHSLVWPWLSTWNWKGCVFDYSQPGNWNNLRMKAFKLPLQNIIRRYLFFFAPVFDLLKFNLRIGICLTFHLRFILTRTL